ncbi:MAG: hypothetical protein RL468_246 [Pseudomonadota bacterium]|jgi:hypothetical protein
MKTSTPSSFLALLFLLCTFLLPGSVEAAGRNGDGIVYNKSDCGYPNVRFYGFGGDGPGSTCDTWSLNRQKLDKVWSDGNHNWSQDDLNTFFAQVEAAAINAANWAKNQARNICFKAIPPMINQAMGRDCRSTAAKFGSECTAELGLETEGLAVPACIAGAVAIGEQCNVRSFIEREIIEPVTSYACNKI